MRILLTLRSPSWSNFLLSQGMFTTPRVSKYIAVEPPPSDHSYPCQADEQYPPEADTTPARHTPTIRSTACQTNCPVPDAPPNLQVCWLLSFRDLTDCAIVLNHERLYWEQIWTIHWNLQNCLRQYFCYLWRYRFHTGSFKIAISRSFTELSCVAMK